MNVLLPTTNTARVLTKARGDSASLQLYEKRLNG